MTNEQILKVLKNERECILSNHDYCYENCNEFCPYYVSGVEKMEVLDFLIKIIENEAIQIADVSEEDKAKIVQSLANAGYNIAPELAEKYLGVVDEFSRDYFKGICPYTNKKCEKWTCNICEVEKREHKFMEGDNG